MLVFDNDYRCGIHPMTGFHFRETRYLSRWYPRINGTEPFFCSRCNAGPNAIECTAIFPPVEAGGTGGTGSGGETTRYGIAGRAIDIRVRYVVRPAGFDAEWTIINRWHDAVEVTLAVELGADFVSISEARSGRRQEHAEVEREEGTESIGYRFMHPDLPLRTQVVPGPPHLWTAAEDTLSARLRLPRQQPLSLWVRVRANDPEVHMDEQAMVQREQRLQRWRSSLVQLSSSRRHASLVQDAASDIGAMALLHGESDEWLAPAAGIPLYQGLFGRDALTASWQMAFFDRGEMLGHVLNRLGRSQGRKVDSFRDERPGRIIQQARMEPSARLGLNPFSRYYGDYASPFMFIIALAHQYAWSGDTASIRRHWDACRGIMDWAQAYGDRDRDGYLEYLTESPLGPKHQGWKDSNNAIVDEEGRQVEPPVATCELQGYWYASMQAMSLFAALVGRRSDAIAWWKAARRLKERFNRDFWVADEGYIGLCLDRDKRLVRCRASNMGHCLAAGIVDSSRISTVVSALFAADLHSGWGIRTLSTTNPAYNPLSYHLGSLWPAENATIAFGLRRYGLDTEAQQLAEALFDLGFLWREGRVPECVGGYDRHAYVHPGAFPRANAPQAWNASTYPLLIHTLLGLQPVAPLHLLLLDPILPSWLPDLTVEGLRLGGGSMDLRFVRGRNGRTRWKVLRKTGKAHIFRQPPVNSLSATLMHRLGILVRGML